MKYLARFILILLCIFSISSDVKALQNIIDVPSTQVLEKNTFLLKESTNVFPYGDERVQVTPSISFGLGHGFEGSVSLPVNINFSEGLATEKIRLKGKKTFYLGNENNRFMISGGIIPSLNMPVCPDMQVYALFAKRIPKTLTTITAGGYMVGDQHFLNTGGVVLGLEQGFFEDKFKIVTEWSSGYNSRSNWAVGMKFRPVKDLSITTAVIMPNREYDNIGFKLTLSKTIRMGEKEEL